MLGHAHVDAHRRAVDVLPVESRVGHRLVGQKDADAAGAGSAADLFAFLITKLVEVADPRQGGAEIAGFVGLNAALPLQQGLTKLGQGVPVRRGKSHPGNHNPLMIWPFQSDDPAANRCQTTKATRLWADWQAADGKWGVVPPDYRSSWNVNWLPASRRYLS